MAPAEGCRLEQVSVSVGDVGAVRARVPCSLGVGIPDVHAPAVAVTGHGGSSLLGFSGAQVGGNTKGRVKMEPLRTSRLHHTLPDAATPRSAASHAGEAQVTGIGHLVDALRLPKATKT